VRNLTKTLAILSLLTPVVGYPLGVGDFKLHSALNQNLNAEIPLSLSEGDNIADIKVGLAPAAKFDEKGVPWTYFLSKIKFQVVSGKSGSAVIKISSQEVLKEPFLNLVLEVSSPKGNVYREFTVLIDPPSTYQAPLPVVAPPTASKVTAPTAMPRVPASANRPVTPAVPDKQPPVAAVKLTSPTPSERVPSQTSASYGPVHPKETLWSIAVKLSKEQGVGVDQMLMALYETNPDAFSRNNVFGLMPGVTLQVPSYATATKLSAEQAKEAYALHKKAWKNGTTLPSTATTVAENTSTKNVASEVAPSKTAALAPTNATKSEDLFAADKQKQIAQQTPAGGQAPVKLVPNPPVVETARERNIAPPPLAKEKVILPTEELAPAPEDKALLKRVAALEKQLNATKKALEAKEKQIDQIKHSETNPVEPAVTPVDSVATPVKPVAPLSTVAPSTPFEAINPVSKLEPIKPTTPLTELASTPVKPVEISSAPLKPVEITPAPLKPVEITSAPLKPIETTSAPVKPTDATPAPVKPTDATPAPVKPTDATPAPVKPTDATPAPVKPTDATPAPVKPTDATPAPVKPTDATPAPVKPTDATPATVKPTDATPATVKPTNSTPATVKPTDATPAPVKPTDATPAPVKPVEIPPTPVKPVEQPEELGILDTNPEYLIGGSIASLTVLSILGFWFRNRRRAMEEPMFPPSTAAMKFKGVSSPLDDGSESTDSGLNLAFNPSEFQGKSIFEPDWNIDIEEQSEIDPISEADVYLAYARYQQAEELMRDAIKEQPDRDECKLKLLEIFYASENKDAFEQYANELARAGKRSNSDFWEKVMEMGGEICPDSALFSDSQMDDEVIAHVADTTSAPITEDKGVAGDLSDFDDDEIATNVAVPEATSQDDFDFNDFDVDDDKAEAAPAVATAPETTSQDDFDFDSFDVDDGKAETTPAVTNQDDFDFDSFDVDGDKAGTTPAVTSQDDFDFDSFDVDGGKAETTPAVTSQDDFDFDNFDVDDEVEATPVATSQDDFDFDNFDVDHKVEAIPAAVARPTTNPDELETFDFDDFALENKAEAEPSTATRPTANPDELETFDFDDFALDNKTEAASTTTRPTASPDELEAFDFDDFAVDNKAEVASATRPTANPDELETFDFDDFAMDSQAAEPVSTVSVESKDDFESFDFDDFAMDSKAETGSAIATPESVADDFDSFDFDLGDSNAEQVLGLAESASSAIDLDLDFDFDMPMGSAGDNKGSFGSPDLTDMDDLETKLDLAKAYIEMGDPSAARDIVNEVITSGTAEQKKAAESLLTRLK
jgi:FimV-like protein